MTDIQFRSDMTVELVDRMGNDYSVVAAARISTGRDQRLTRDFVTAKEQEAATGLINFLMKNRHGTPFEHNAFTFRIEAPIFVWREFHRHRIGFSYNEQSSRYMELPPMFYIPDDSRNLVQTGKPGHYVFQPGTQGQYQRMEASLFVQARAAYDEYEEMLRDDIAKEVARMVLPVNIYSSCYVTCNARSLMSFLSLRTKHEHSKFPSYPQREIEMVAEQMEVLWSECMPLTSMAFHEFGRVSP